MTDVSQLRDEVAICTRMLASADILNYSGHVSSRIHGTGQLLIQQTHDVRTTVAPGRLLVVDLDGRVVDGAGEPPSEVFIHTETYRARPDVAAVPHFHHDPTTVFSVADGVQLVPVKNHAARWQDGIPVHPDSSHIDDRAKGAAMASTLGGRHALLLRGHGEVIVAEDVLSLYADSVHFVENARTLTLAAQIGAVNPLSAGEMQGFLATFDRAKHARKLWKYYTSLAARQGVIPSERVLDQEAA